ncbi:hypothetical protein ES319_A06G079000v1 [Gossypium barbadense]|uniref:Uncharacterized protein n=3 Tax=Gossypium TaxID=3633 RepID=A0A5J5VBD4_GOSBA|nr:uncharacterized protein LOC121230446 [Gossypium hirsutum]KAB2077074.1 hypothetical protein ES319_A06G079000v1 [Gossypium barbadense]KAB2077075.1 hypothetical protein ES319_A06G079000v1 [Gossypium barbadense]TYH12710.1 hypothetical protein ES288_A06G088600v1 [Gossypium darwinii]
MGAVDLYPLSHIKPIGPVACWPLLPSIKATNIAGAIRSLGLSFPFSADIQEWSPKPSKIVQQLEKIGGLSLPHGVVSGAKDKSSFVSLCLLSALLQPFFLPCLCKHICCNRKKEGQTIYVTGT